MPPLQAKASIKARLLDILPIVATIGRHFTVTRLITAIEPVIERELGRIELSAKSFLSGNKVSRQRTIA